MGTSSGANFQHHQPAPQGQGMPPPPPRPNGRAPALQTSLSLGAAASSEQVGSAPDAQEPLSNSDAWHDSATESASSRETWPEEPGKSGGGGGPPVAAAPLSAVRIADSKDKEVVGNSLSELHAVRGRIPGAGRVTLREIAGDRVDVVAGKMKVMGEELLDEVKTELRLILEGAGGSHHMEEFLYLQKLVQGRVDLTPAILSVAHHVQLEVLVAIKTGIQAFLHPSVNISQSRLTEVFLFKRCRNLACQSALPAEECKCNICSNRNGFYNLCMCVVCYKFDFEVNTCRWIGCDVGSHWTHTDCAILMGRLELDRRLRMVLAMQRCFSGARPARGI